MVLTGPPGFASAPHLSADRMERVRIRLLMLGVQAGGQLRERSLYQLREKAGHPLSLLKKHFGKPTSIVMDLPPHRLCGGSSLLCAGENAQAIVLLQPFPYPREPEN